MGVCVMTDEVFAILRSAVTVAKNKQIGKVEKLKAELLALYPGKEAAITEALVAWGAHARRNAA